MIPSIKTAIETIGRGGPVVWVILVLSVLLYSRGFSLFVRMIATCRQIERDFAPGPDALRHCHLLVDSLAETYERERGVLAAMIAAAPLLGLLGTVTGMIATFRHLATGGGNTMTGGLADGISEALIATAAGLSVAIPGVLLLYALHRQMQRGHTTFTRLEQAAQNTP